MRWPTIDETRAIVYITAAFALSVALIWAVARGDYEFLTPFVSALLAVISAVNGIALQKRNSSGKAWSDPHGEKQDQLPPLP